MKFKILIIASLSLLIGCGKQFKSNDQQTNVYSSQILSLVNNALKGSVKANDSLGSLLDMKYQPKADYNRVFIDSITNYRGKRIYFVMLEHPVPLFNRFAIYDEKLRCYLIDKSLNGNLKSSVYRSEGEVLIQVDEEFVSKDDLELTRRSLYLVKNDTSSLSFRNFISLKKGDKNFIQDISAISKDSIVTDINFGGNQDRDVFIFNPGTLRFESPAEKFQKKILDEISSYKKEVQKPQIVDERTALEALGMTPKEDTINNTNNYKNKEEGFTVFIPGDWKVIPNFTVQDQLKKQCKSTYFLNASKGAKFYVIKIAQNDSAETFINLPFTNFVKGKYFVRFTDKTEVGNSLYLYFEISCSDKKFLFYFEVPKLIYEDNKSTFESIINSFEIEC